VTIAMKQSHRLLLSAALLIAGAAPLSAQISSRGSGFDRDSRVNELRKQAALEKIEAEIAANPTPAPLATTPSEQSVAGRRGISSGGAPGVTSSGGVTSAGGVSSTGQGPVAFRPIPRPSGIQAIPQDNPIPAGSELETIPPLLDPTEPGNVMPDIEADAGDTVVLRVSVGGARRTVVIELNPAVAPRTVANFKQRINEGYYDGQAFHRAIPGYLIQAGDPLTLDDDARADWGTGGPGFTIPGEFGGSHRRGALGMARLGDAVNPTRASSGSQFFVCLSELTKLDGRYTIFGQVISGMDVIDAIARQSTDANDIPLRRIEILSASLSGKERATELAESTNDRPIPTLAEDSSGSASTRDRKTSRFIEGGEDKENPRASTAPKRLKNPSEGGFFRSIW